MVHTLSAEVQKFTGNRDNKRVKETVSLALPLGVPGDTGQRAPHPEGYSQALMNKAEGQNNGRGKERVSEYSADTNCLRCLPAPPRPRVVQRPLWERTFQSLKKNSWKLSSLFKGQEPGQEDAHTHTETRTTRSGKHWASSQLLRLASHVTTVFISWLIHFHSRLRALGNSLLRK